MMELILIVVVIALAASGGVIAGRRSQRSTFKGAANQRDASARHVALGELDSMALETGVPQIDDRWHPQSHQRAAAGVPQDLWLRVGEVFSPSAPVHRRDLFAGRHLQMEELVDVAFERGQHAAIFGERGIGKTSLATIMTAVFGTLENKLAIKVNCDATDDFDTVWRKVVDELQVVAALSDDKRLAPRSPLGLAVAQVEKITRLRPDHVRKFFRLLSDEWESIVFVDEFERLTDDAAAASFAETIKLLSDQSIAVTIFIVGVADSLQELLSEHGSVERTVAQIKMPRMSRDELADIVERGLRMIDMKIDHVGLASIVSISCGLPHFTHLIAQTAARAAIDARETELTIGHVHDSIKRLAHRTQETVEIAYSLATDSNRDTIYPEVLLACALAPSDDKGFFSASDVVEPLEVVMGRSYPIPSFSRHLHAMSEPARGPALLRKGSEHKHRFRFKNALFQPYVLMKGLADGSIDHADLARFLAQEQQIEP